MTPIQLFISSLVGVVEAHSNYVVCFKDLLEVCVSFCGRLLAISVVLIFNSNGLSVSWSLVMLIQSLS